MKSVEAFNAIVDSIYDAATDQTLWSSALKQIVRETGGFAGALVLWDTAKNKLPNIYDINYHEGAFAEYGSHYINSDIRVKPWLKRRDTDVYSDAMLVSAEAKRKNECLDWLKRKNEQHFGYGARIFSNNGHESTLMLGRSARQGEAQLADLRKLALFLPHMRRSLAIAEKIGDRPSTEAFNALSFGVVILNELGQVGFSNTAMSKIAAERDGLRLSSAGLALDNIEEDAAFRRLTENMRRKMFFGAQSQRTALSATRPSGKRPYSLIIYPFSRQGSLLPSSGQQVLICVSDPADTKNLTEEMLVALFGLSPAEGRLAINLVEFGSLRAAAAECGLTEGSARQYMKRIFSKTGTQGQVELVAVIMGATRS